jgi:ribonucleotide monophosphatase NagD (HAD superfamily)
LLGTEKSRTLAIGDSLRTDMQGAKYAAIDACWVLSGIHATHSDEAPEQAARAGITPVSILRSFSW